MQLVYPKAFTDPEWKKTEKKIKVSDTGVGKTLRDLQKVIVAINSELGGGKDVKKLATLLKTAKAATKKSEDAIRDQSRKEKSGSPAQKYLGDFAWKMSAYGTELGDFDPADHRGLDWPVDRFNDRVKSRCE